MKELPMRPASILRLTLLAAILMTCGCKSNNKGKIEGKWSSIASTVKGKAVPEGFLTLEFGTDGSLVYAAGPITFKGTYSLGMGDNVTLKLDKELAGRKNHTEKVSISGDRLTMTDSDGTALTFKKVK
jgi:hypothetical protein